MWPWKKKQKQKFDPTIKHYLNFSTSDEKVYYIKIDKNLNAENLYNIIALITFVYEYDVDEEDLLIYAREMQIDRFLIAERQMLNL